MPEPPWLEYLYAALRSKSGKVIRVSDFDRARQRLYKARRDALDPDLDSLSFLQSPTDATELWIVHGKAKSDAS